MADSGREIINYIIVFRTPLLLLLEKFLRCPLSTVRDKRTAITLFVPMLLWKSERVRYAMPRKIKWFTVALMRLA